MEPSCRPIISAPAPAGWLSPDKHSQGCVVVTRTGPGSIWKLVVS